MARSSSRQEPTSAPIKRRRKMRVMVFVKATEDSEKGLPPTEEMTEMFEAMGKFNEELVNAGVMVDGDGLKPSSAGKRSEEHTSELQSLMRISYAVFCLKKKRYMQRIQYIQIQKHT